MNSNLVSVFSRLILFGVMTVASPATKVSGLSMTNMELVSGVSQFDYLDDQLTGNVFNKKTAGTPNLSPTFSASDSCGGPVVVLSGITTSQYFYKSVPDGTTFDRTAWYSDAVGNGGENSAFSVGKTEPSPKDVCVLRGVINGHIPLAWSWRDVHDFGGHGDETYTGRLALIDGARIHNVEDGWRPRELPEFGNTGIMQMRNTYMTGVRDDSIENDDFMPGFIEDSLFDGVDTFLSEQNQSGGTPSTIGTNEDRYIYVTRVYVRLYSTNSSGNSNPGRWFKWQARGTTNHNLIITDSVFATHGPSPRDGWSALNFPSGTTFRGTNYILWLGTPGGYGATVPAGVIFLEGQPAFDKWNQVRNDWLTSHGYDPRPSGDFDPMDDPVVAPNSFQFKAYGNQLFRTSNPPETFTIKNTNASDITLGTLQGSSSVGTTWSSSKSFFIENDACSGATLSADSTCTFAVRFLPWRLGFKTGTITLPSDASDQPYVFYLTGTSIPGSQLLQNRSFDSYSASTGLPDLWSESPLFKVGLDGEDDSWTFHGSFSVKLVGDGDLKVLSQRVDKPGKAGDDFSFFVVTHGNNIPADSDRWLLQVMFYNGSTIIENRNVNLKTGSYDYKIINRTYTAENDFTHIIFRIHFGKSSGTAWVDLASLQWAP